MIGVLDGNKKKFRLRTDGNSSMYNFYLLVVFLAFFKKCSADPA